MAPRAWSRDAGSGATRAAAGRRRVSRFVLDHVAFVATDLPERLERLSTRSAVPIKQTEASAFFRVRDGVTIEIVRDTDAPDAVLAPMHPDVRSGATGKCPLCGMALVSMPTPRLGEYRMDVVATPAAGGSGVARLRTTLRHPETGKPVSGFAAVHDRLLHLFIIDRTLKDFAHVHPERAGEGVFESAIGCRRGVRADRRFSPVDRSVADGAARDRDARLPWAAVPRLTRPAAGHGSG